ncbi:DUF305 domain-containing protein [Neorhizobium sp. P12A]|uniref:DUF305 domain-containing protein n=1 Tax=Neorhizobium sp. P12A TaxID=2268027 RepID=UPI0011EF7C0F|nr:DUF305 domain-containing protein [Neorhizobium sp. P12A]KAA0690612.1 DUF305 domain-containing protein [Neorhizobium sp. P12A]
MVRRSNGGRHLLAALLLTSFAGATPSFAQQTAAPVDQSALQAEQPYLSENDAAMTTMMDGMAAKPTGDVDRDFVEMMIPHHQGAIDMAQAYLRYGKNEQLKRIAQEIIVDQQQEIAAMRLALGDPLPPSTPAPTQVAPQSPASTGVGMSAMQGMDPNMKMGK